MALRKHYRVRRQSFVVPGATSEQCRSGVFEQLESRLALASIVVNTIEDTVNASDGVMSLREAVTQAASVAGSDVITFDSSVFSTPQTTTLKLGPIDIPGAGESNKFAIRGPEASLTISGNKNSVGFTIAGGGFLTLENLTLTDCQGVYGGAIINRGDLTTDNVTFLNNVADDRGAGLYNEGTAIIHRSTFTGNKGLSGGGGAIFNWEATLTLSESRISRSYGGYAGALFSRGMITIHKSVVDANWGDGGGGGLRNDGGQVVITDSVFRGNRAAGPGGGIFLDGSSQAEVWKSVFAENTAGSGGAIESRNRLYLHDSLIERNKAHTGGGLALGGAFTWIEQTTISGNSAIGSGGIHASSPFTLTQSTIYANVAGNSAGIGIVTPELKGESRILNSIISGNKDSNGASYDYWTQYPGVFAYSSILGAAGDGSAAIAGADNIFTTDPRLEPLAENGGPTRTHALMSGSPAVDAGSNALAVDRKGIPFPHDQRGIFSRVFNGRVDIGAFEHQGPPIDADEAITTRFRTAVAGNLLDNTTPTTVRTLTIPSFTISGREYASGQVASIQNVGVFVVQQDGLFTFSPNSTFSGDAPAVTYVVSDGTLTDSSTLNIRVLPENFAPTGLQITPSSIAENSLAGAVVGQLTTADPNASDKHVYSLVVGAGSVDNEQFAIAGSTLIARLPFDFETQQAYTVRIRTTDDQDLFLERSFMISVEDMNEPPADLTLSNVNFAEKQPVGTLVGNVSAYDFDAGDSLRYTLIDGEGSQDNSLFKLDGDRLLTATVLDHDVKTEHSLRIRVTDSKGLHVDGVFTIRVINVNEPPAGLLLSGTSVPEDSSKGTVVGLVSAVDPDLGESIVYTLVSGEGSSGNGYFQINGDKLAVAESLDFEQITSHSIRIRATDSGGSFYEKAFTISVTNVNERPTDLILSNTTVLEHAGPNALVGVLDTVDPDAGDAFTYYLIAGNGSTDNRSFNIVGNQLRAVSSFDYATKSIYNVRIRTMDREGMIYDKPFTVQVLDKNEAPTGLVLSSSTIRENSGPNALVGRFTTTDTDSVDQFVYTFSPDASAFDNGQFTLTGNELRAVGSFDYETKDRYVVRIRSTDIGGLSIEREFAILVTDASESIPGDCDRDGIFNSTDLIIAFQAGEYEDATAGNSTWEEGDWDGDGDFNSGDLVLAFQGGNYTVAARAADELIAAWGDWEQVRRRR